MRTYEGLTLTLKYATMRIMFKDATEEHWLWLHQIDGLSAQNADNLLLCFKNPNALYHAEKHNLKEVGNLSEKIADKIINSKKIFNLNNLKQNLSNHNIQYISYNNPSYPALLKETANPPKILFFKGTLPNTSRKILAVVGARKMTPYGRMAISTILPPLAQSGIIIISGLAVGIDSQSHKIALENNGQTIAVIGSGLDQQSIYPAQNKQLAQDIIENKGVIFSEYPPFTPPLPHHFPARNRIIAGLSVGVLIVEASEKSGSLITAKQALSENREVFAVPGPINAPSSAGTLYLIKEGAHPVSHAGDILSVFGYSQKAANKASNNYQKDSLLRLLSNEPQTIDIITKKLNLTTQEVSARLSQLEIKGLIKNVGRNHYIIIKYAP